jgi:hypothetical protein
MNQLPDNLVFLNACPHDPYFTWQQEVLIVNMRKFGISDRIQIIVWYPKGSTHLLKWRDLQTKYPEVKVYLYPDQGVQLGLYVSQLRPHVLARHFDNNAEFFKDKVVFYHDSDIIFNYLPDFQTLCTDDVVYQSDTHFYLDYTYLRNKEKQGNLPEHEAVDLLAKIGRVSRETIQHYDGNTGGAQTLLKNVDGDFWRDVERMCLEIRYNFVHFQEFPINPNSINSRYFQGGNGLTAEQNGFQSWVR